MIPYIPPDPCTLSYVYCPYEIVEDYTEIESVVTAYVLKGIMASGEQVYDGSIACPRYIPLETKIEIFEKKYICKDRMNKRFPDRFDIWMKNKKDAIEFGKQKIKLRIFHKKNNLYVKG